MMRKKINMICGGNQGICGGNQYILLWNPKILRYEPQNLLVGTKNFLIQEKTIQLLFFLFTKAQYYSTIFIRNPYSNVDHCNMPHQAKKYLGCQYIE